MTNLINIVSKMSFINRRTYVLILSTVFLITGQLFAQEKISLKVEWTDAAPVQLNGTDFIVPQIKGQGYHGNLPEFFWDKIIDAKKKYSIELVSFQTETCPKEDLDYLATTGIEIPSTFTPELAIKNGGTTTYAVAVFLPYIKENNVIKRISFVDLNLEDKGKKSTKIAAKSFVTQSVLREGSGTWYKISVTEDGIFKIDKTFLEECGINTSGLNPNHINVFGNGEGMLPETNSTFRTDDLAKNAIQIIGDADGSFDDGDYILFHGFGPHRWYANGLASFERKTNTYSDVSTYFININPNETPSRIQTLSSSTSPSNYNVTESDFRLTFETETTNLVKGGQRWYGDLFDTELSKTYNFSVPNATSDDFRYKIALAANAPSNSNRLTVFSNGTNIYDTPLPIVSQGDFNRFPSPYIFTATGSSNVSLNLTVTRTQPTVLTYLDYITINAKRDLVFYGSEMGFRNLSSVGPGIISKFTVSNFNNSNFVWDITDRQNPKRITGNLVGSNFEFAIATDTLREFIASNGSNFRIPNKVGPVGYQNLHALPQADYIIITHPSFVSQANRLADLHRANGTSVHVVTENLIFNEFGSGMRDATAIKYFMKMFYDRGQITNDGPKSLLLFGDGTFDHRSKTTSDNYVMTYQVEESENHISAMVTDDYFGLLDDNEGISQSDKLDIGIGRLLVSNTQIAKEQVDKVEHYMKNGSNFYTTPGDCDCSPSQTQKTFGDWRMKYVQITDDPDTENGYWDFVIKDTEPQTSIVETYRREMNVDKVYSDAYQQISTAGGQRFPEVNEAINDRMRRGVLVMNYVGHGGETGVASERIITVPQILDWKNSNGMPLLVSATCEFTKYDDPDRVSAGEWASLNSLGGAIALMTTTRSVYFSVNNETGKSFYDNVFRRDTDSLPRTFGEIIRQTKNQTSSSSDNKRSFTLIGDPGLRIAMPHLKVVADSIYRDGNNNLSDTVRALDKMTLVGHVEDHFGNILTDFNGVASPTLFDKPTTEYTLAQDPGTAVTAYEQQKNAIFKGQATISSGYFKISFIVPKDINFGVGNGKISMYGHNNQTDAMGYDNSVVIGGVNPDGIADDKGPDIELFMNDESFVPGGITDENPILIAKLFDENGINAVGTGIGHDISVIIDEESGSPIILNNYYLADLDTYQSGEVNYNFIGLEPGLHTLTLKAWDVNNNSSTASIQFTVKEEESPELAHVLNYPNPFTTSTQFFFEHNQVNTSLETQIQIFTISGRLVKTINQLVNTVGFRTEGIAWDGKDDFGDQLAKGVYVYKLTIKTDSGEKAEKLEKLVLLK